MGSRWDRDVKPDGDVDLVEEHIACGAAHVLVRVLERLLEHFDGLVKMLGPGRVDHNHRIASGLPVRAAATRAASSGSFTASIAVSI